MTIEQDVFLNIISDHLHGERTIPLENVDWHKICSYAKCHQLEGIINHQLQDFFSNRNEYIEIARRLKNAKLSCLYAYAYNSHAFNEIQDEFQRKNILFFPVKGLEIASCYPIPIYRTMGDLDIIVSHKNIKKASKILVELGYRVVENDYGLQLKKGHVNLEIDDHLLHRESLENGIRRHFFDTCWKHLNVDSNGEYHLDKNFHYLYLLEHTKKHFRTRGIGFRQFIDLAVFVQHNSDLNWEWIKTQLQKINLWKFALLAHSFIYRWWGIESPLKIETIDEEFYRKTTDYVFSSGVFGFDNTHKSLYVTEAVMNSGSSGLLSPVFSFLKNFFIPYRKMIKLPYCSFVEGKIWLLPFGWIYRAIYISTKKKGLLKKQNNWSIESQTIMNDHRCLMEKWGI